MEKNYKKFAEENKDLFDKFMIDNNDMTTKKDYRKEYNKIKNLAIEFGIDVDIPIPDIIGKICKKLESMGIEIKERNRKYRKELILKYIDEHENK